MRNTRVDINEWLDANAEGDPTRRSQAEDYIRELAEFLRRCAGPPPGAVREPGVLPPTHWWDYCPDLWIRFTVRDDPKKWFGLFGERVRRITVLQLRDAPPFEREQ